MVISDYFAHRATLPSLLQDSHSTMCAREGLVSESREKKVGFVVCANIHARRLPLPMQNIPQIYVYGRVGYRHDEHHLLIITCLMGLLPGRGLRSDQCLVHRVAASHSWKGRDFTSAPILAQHGFSCAGGAHTGGCPSIRVLFGALA